MKWIKVGDKNPIDDRDLLLYYKAPSIGGFELGFYDASHNIFREWNSCLETIVSYWSYIKLPPGEDDE